MFKRLQEMVKSKFEKKFKNSDTTFQKASEEKPPTGLIIDNPLLEYILDRRFLAYGRFYLTFGRKGASKTSLFYDLCKVFQRNNGKVVWIETEHAIDLDYAKLQGVDLESVVLCHPTTLEEALNMAEGWIRSLKDVDPDGQMPVLICLDSIAGSVTEYESEEDNNITNVTPGAHARVLSRFYRELERPLANERCIFLALNQQREKIGGFGFGEKISLLGGDSQLFHSTYHWKIEKTGELKHKDKHGAERKYGSEHQITGMRNKLGREGPTQKIKFDLYINGGIDWYTPLVRKLGEEYTSLVDRKSALKNRWKVEGMTYLLDGVETPIPTDKEDKAAWFHETELARIIANSTQAKEAIREAFGIPGLPSEAEVKEVEQDRLTKRKKKKEAEL